MLPLTAELSRSTGPASSNRSTAAEQMAQDHLDLDAREVRADAEVLTEAEREVRVRRPVDAERRTDRRTRPRRGSPTRSTSASCSPARIAHAAELAVLGGDAGEVADRARPTAGSRRPRSAAAPAGRRSFSHSPGCSQNASSPPLIALRVVSLPASTNSSQYDEELLVGERHAVDRAADQLAHQVVPRFAAALARSARAKYAWSSPRARLMVWPGDSPSRRNSGSSLPMTSLLSRNSRSQSALGDAEDPGDHARAGTAPRSRSTKSSPPDAPPATAASTTSTRDAVELVALAPAPPSA